MIYQANQSKPKFRLFKISIIGSKNSGKSTFLKELLKYESTSRFNLTFAEGIEFNFINDQLNFHLKFYNLQKGYTNNLAIRVKYEIETISTLIFLNLNDKSSFDNMKNDFRIQPFYENKLEFLFLIGNKSDLGVECNFEEILEFCHKFNLVYLEISTKTGRGINELLNMIFQSIFSSLSLKKLR